MSTSRPKLLPAASMLLVLAFALPAAAVEYRLRVANVFDGSLTSFLSPGELNDGARGPGFQRLDNFLTEGSSDRARVGRCVRDRAHRAGGRGVVLGRGALGRPAG